MTTQPPKPKPTPEVREALINKFQYQKSMIVDTLKQIRKFSRMAPMPHKFDGAIAVKLRELDWIEAELYELGVQVR